VSSTTDSASLTIRHDYDGGTTVEGTTRDSAAHLALKQHPSWVWARSVTAWLLRASRHRLPKLAAITDIEQRLTALGYTVTRDIDPTMPDVEQREADLAGRLDARSERLSERAARTQDTADAARRKADAVFDNIPAGQPMLVGHHSYPADRRRRDRAWDNLGKGIALDGEAERLREAAATAATHVSARHNPVTTMNRIEALEADRRRLQRRLEGRGGWVTETDENGDPRARLGTVTPSAEYAERLHGEIAELDAQISHWRGIYTQLQAEGRASTLGPDTVAKGDLVHYLGSWYRVLRVNTKSVSVPNLNFPAPRPGEREVTWTIAWHKLTGHRPAAPEHGAAAAPTTASARVGIAAAALEPASAHHTG
jgi:hypothetical protein